MRISDWSSDVCSSDLLNHGVGPGPVGGRQREDVWEDTTVRGIRATVAHGDDRRFIGGCAFNQGVGDTGGQRIPHRRLGRSEEHTSELQSLMRISYAGFCLKKKNKAKKRHNATYKLQA